VDNDEDLMQKLIMNSRDQERLQYYIDKITEVAHDYQVPGLNTDDRISTFASQCLDSEKRIRYIQVIDEKDWDDSVLNPDSNGFDPIKATSLLKRRGEYDEAVWMCYLGTFFGKHKTEKWGLARAVYGMLGEQHLTWEYVIQNINDIRSWLDENEGNLRQAGKFSNHRKYVSIKNSGTGRAFASYIDWVGNAGHRRKFDQIINEVDNDPKVLFDHMYKKMDTLYQFDRMGKFDFLCMLGKAELICVEPEHAYLKKATGPKSGLTALLKNAPGDQVTLDRMNDFTQLMSEALDNQYFIMQILEDAICNWQKSPSNYIYFSG